MFEELLQKVSVKISTVRGIVETSHRLRIIVFRDSLNKQKLEDNPELAILIEIMPSEEEWEIYDRSAVVTRLYAIYERFVEDLISDWLRLLPDLVPRYSDLEEKIQNTHREGIGRLLIDIKKNRFQHLKITEWFKKPQAGVAKVKKVTLTLGECVFLVLVNDNLSYCYAAKVESIQLNDISHDRLEITSEAEVGLKFDRDARKGLTIYVTKSNQVD
ncbi:MAE_28990/MAE_18760 family HEPN-like nuclease [Microcoleus sp. EPA2]|uniref:MAE_28990/MAE_18760 family HEPN-like nuclease n=1 Tax=Microcoleus sp. EPA2 TaxID=2841654 RepID=UPI00312B49C4